MIDTPGRAFVLAHGSWHGGWCYARVAERLRRQGHRVFTPTLTGLADRSHLLSPAVTLDTHIADIVNLIEWESLDDILLCGHSFGGMVVTGVADALPDRIRSLVYLDAFIPENGQSICDINDRPPPTTPSEPAPAAAAFGVNEADRAWVDAKCTPHPNGSRAQKIALTGAWKTIPRKTYIRASDWPSAAFDRYAAALAADPAWRVRSIAGAGHDLMIDAPETVARMLEEAAV